MLESTVTRARNRAAALALLLLGLVSPGIAVAGGRAEYAFVQYPVEKVRQGDRPAAMSSVVVRCAGNEYESALIGFRNPGAASAGVSAIHVSRGMAAPAELSLYRIQDVPITAPSRWFSSTKGPWPDALIPIVPRQGAGSGGGGSGTSWVFEKTIDVPPGQSRTFLLEMYLPTGERQPEDIAISLELSDGRAFPLQVRIEPWTFDLPGYPSLATAFGFRAGLVVRKHGELSTVPFSRADLVLDYLHLLARYRVSVGFPYEQSPAVLNTDGSLTFDWNGFDNVTGKALDGTLFPDAPPATSFQVPALPPGLSPGQKEAFFREAAAHAREKGWLSRMFYYLPDEPLRSDYPRVRAAAEIVRAADPAIRTLVTEPYTTELQGAVSIWCPDIPYMGDSIPFMPFAFRSNGIVPDWQSDPPPSRYLERRARGEDAWLYTCNSAVVLDYPNLFIDAGASAHRVIPWLAFRYGFTGLLYWHSVYSYGQPGSPWDSPLVLNLSNGDGNLLYPGVPGRPDVPTHRPIPSLRLQILRDGLEDYEYLVLASRLVGLDEARAAAARVAGASLRWVHDSDALERIRQEIATRIVSAP